MSDYGGYVDSDYLEASGRILDHVKDRSRTLLSIRPGSSVLDIGCGPGIDTVEIGEIVGPTGRVLGVDADPDMVAAANERASVAGSSAWVAHAHGSAEALDLDDDSFDATRSERMIQHLADPRAAVREMVRVTRPAGRVVAIDTDWASLSMDSDLIDVERRLVRHKAETLTRRGTAGRELFRLLRAAGLREVTVEPFALYANFSLFRLVAMWDDLIESALTHSVVTEEEATAIEAELTERDAAGWSYGTLTLTIAAGTK